MLVKITETFARLGSADMRHYLWLALALGVAGLVFVLLRRRWHPTWRRFYLAVIVVILLRIVLYDNPLAWRGYKKYLSMDTLGFRHHNEMMVEYEKYPQAIDPKTEKPSIPYLAVGSSQAYATFQGHDDTEYIGNHYLNIVGIFSVVGMGPMEMLLYEHQILQRNPECIILMISDFDLCRPPALEGILTGPKLGSNIVPLYKGMQDNHELNIRETLASKVVGDRFPEYQYSFIPKGFLKRWLKPEVALSERLPASIEHANAENEKPFVPASPSEVSEDKWLEVHLDILSREETMHIFWLETNLRMLKSFIARMHARDIEIVIAQSQYHPLGYIPRNLEYRAEVDAAMRELDETDDQLLYFNENEIVLLTAEDYRDGYHINEAASRRFVVKLIDKLDRYFGRPVRSYPISGIDDTK